MLVSGFHLTTLITLVINPCIAIVTDPRHGDISTQAELSLPDYVTRYAPLVWLHSEDPFRPSDLLAHLQHTAPSVNASAIQGLPALDLDNLEILNQYAQPHSPVALTSKDDVSTLPLWFYGQLPNAEGKTEDVVPCVVIMIDKDYISPKLVDVFYFYFYSYDRGSNISQVLEPLNRMVEDTEHGMHFGDHVGDWEHSMIRFQDGEPTGIYYSQHTSGEAFDWDDKGLSWKGERPFVYSAYGSHANYASAGDHVHDAALIDYCDAGPLWDPALSAYFYHFDPKENKLSFLHSTSSIPQDSLSSTNKTSFFYFEGIWGDAQYPDDHPLQRTVPRFGLKRFTSGPQGPAVKHLLRKGLAPDKGPHLSWLEWEVRIFMAWYPCCIKGFRKWVSLAVLTTCWALLLVLVVKGMRRYRRRRGYKKLETNIPMQDLEPAR